MLRSERLLLYYTPLVALDVMGSAAARSDAEAQRWLGNEGDNLVQDEDTREWFLSMRADDDLSGFEARDRLKLMRRPMTGLRARQASNLKSGEIGGWLAPGYRRQGLGVELFRAAIQLGHRHLGFNVVRAGAEPTNKPSREALEAAGFATVPGPPRFTLGDGREVDACWYQHRQEAISRCRGGSRER
ncbi:GNAT family N-acetyltransferase [Streptomyces aureus]|uniref:GNAT family N-acetyltransferase n=1 Tax=Streptomyces aureus TaxID=193461 RepID=UPI00099BBB5B|nr:GNAT family N-acetyltransferase [Streptomyces aureus]